METECAKCGKTFDPDKEGARIGKGRCPICAWHADEKVLSEDEERYLVFLSLIYRLESDGEKKGEMKYRIIPSDREMAVLRHGDQCRVDGDFWRITARNEQSNVIWLIGTREWQLDELKAWSALTDQELVGKWFVDSLITSRKDNEFLQLSEEKKQERRERFLEKFPR